MCSPISIDDVSSAKIVIKGYSHDLISYPVRDEFLGSTSISVLDFLNRDAGVEKYHYVMISNL